jgi:hypothetical protein
MLIYAGIILGYNYRTANVWNYCRKAFSKSSEYKANAFKSHNYHIEPRSCRMWLWQPVGENSDQYPLIVSGIVPKDELKC